MKFIDEVKILVTSGKGGDGFVGWRREAHVPRGGPIGGNGGNGGAVVLIADENEDTLVELSYNPLVKAKDGQAGGPKDLEGKTGADRVIRVPVGTQVFFNDKLVADLSVPGSRWIAARGGRGGRGNAFFKSSTRQSPDYAEVGQPGEVFEFRLVLKSVADVGLVGFPNVGKSTLLSRISEAKPLIGDYPFTTLSPHLGVVAVNDQNRFVVADIPGLIRGAHEGKGLGIRFLKHIERTSVLLQLIDATLVLDSADEGIPTADNYSDKDLRQQILSQFIAIEDELKSFSVELLSRPRAIAFSKGDLELTRRAFLLTRDEFLKQGRQVHLISSVSGEGLPDLLADLASLLKQQK